MKTSEIKKLLGEVTPAFSQIDKLFIVDSDAVSDLDSNRNVQLFELSKFDCNLLDAVVNLSGFDNFNNGCIAGSVFLDYSNKDGTTNQLKIAEPCYQFNAKNAQFSNLEALQIIKELWIDAFNQFKHVQCPGLNKPDSSETPKASNGLLNSIKGQLKLKPIGIATIALISASSFYWFGSTNAKLESNTNQNIYQNNQAFDGVQDGRDLALKNLGIDQKAAEVDNSCFKSN